MGYPGYPQQNWQGGHPPQMGYMGPGPRRSGPGLAVTSGIVGVGAGGLLLVQTIMLLSDLSDLPAEAELPAGWTIMNILHFVIAGMALLGAVLVFARQIAGAFLLLVAGLLTVTMLLLDPVLAEGLWASMLGAMPSFNPSGDYANYFKAMFEFGNEQAVMRFVVLVLGFVLLIMSALPPSLNWLRRPGRDPYNAYQQGW